jgi:hypothetical protein
MFIFKNYAPRLFKNELGTKKNHGSNQKSVKNVVRNENI